ncbi:6-pyruvoyl trahydropterin synthase family protein [Notoacmeibacter ruber]|uniref:6-carboxy-5,6,7,8-tetrahydropterin synthase n=1 Tax=Notoacmeibacter ruber TaxID=2670375 RepID=A0A3L7JDK9_9HYPH|nr:6-carboxytetrahydropterin synthase [Notoacmeibacter ruber]RLQ88395.1 6-carboxytetrahydropterin synthase [Notoacmeibacter ruber]
MTNAYRITRRIGIDAGHRIRLHGSKCRNLHGHRYTIEAVCEAHELAGSGEQAGMVLDFGFLKDEMMAEIDSPCDHGFIAEAADQDLLTMFAPKSEDAGAFIDTLRQAVEKQGFAQTVETALGTKLYVIGPPPTAENLARHWFERLASRVEKRSEGRARLVKLVVWETPNCSAEWPAN